MQLIPQDLCHANAQPLDVAASCPTDYKSNIQVPNQDVKRESTTTSSQKLYQSHALEIAEEYEQAIEANSLEKIIKLLDKVLD